MMSSTPGRHSSNTRAADSNASRRVEDDVAVESSFRSRPSKRFSWAGEALVELGKERLLVGTYGTLAVL
jgi:hypothetical protein